jgi:single-strand DNA-binding protein
MYNKVVLIGRLGKDVELKELDGDKCVAKFSLATTYGFGERSVTDWHNIVVWDKAARNCAKFLSKGKLVAVEGRVSQRSWEKDGKTNYITEVIASDVKFLESSGATSKDVEKAPAKKETASLDDIPF